jgi:hypothetical protein
MGDISKGVANTLLPAKKSYKKEQFFEDINIFISTFCVCAYGFQGFSRSFKTFHHPIQLLTFLLL